MARWHNVFQPIYQVDAQLKFLNSIANEVAGQRWLQFESASLRELFHRHPDIRVHLNIDPVQFAYPSVWAFLKNAMICMGITSLSRSLSASHKCKLAMTITSSRLFKKYKRLVLSWPSMMSVQVATV